ncbi:MAG: hypothetical protein QM723_29465 [Myxococcaceae bacterium]
MNRAWGALVIASLGAVSSGCFRKYRDPESHAIETFSEKFSCPDNRVKARQSGELWMVEGCNKLASCDIVSGTWGCTATEPAYQRAWKEVVARTQCPKEQVVPKQQTQTGPGDTRVRIDACGELFNCKVLELGDVTCEPMNAGPMAAPLAGPPPPPPPPSLSPAAECVPKCRSGYSCQAGACVAACTPACRSGTVCVKGACVSACNPPCGKGERCLDSGECAAQ